MPEITETAEKSLIFVENTFMIKAVIVDDEVNIREAVARMVQNCCPNASIIALAEGVKSAVAAINEHEADLVISDIRMDDGSGFDIIRFEESLRQQALGETIKDLNKSHRLVLKTADQVHVVNIEDIVHVEADSNYSTFFMHDGRKIMVSKAMKEYEEQLLEHGFHRIHKSHLVNIHKMSHLDKADGGFLVMMDGARVPVASRKKDMLMELFDGLE